MDDMRLLRRYVEEGSQEAFAELVSRHVNWVYGVCRRRVSDPALAEDVTQAVFIVLARKAGSMPEATVLAGWLMRTAGYASSDALKREARRRRHEREAARMQSEQATMAGDPVETADLMPRVDAALATLSTSDRAAITLRFYGHKSLAEVATALGVSEEAAKKRVARGLEKLRSRLGVRAGAVTAATLGALILTATVEAAPAGVQATAAAAGAAGQTGAAVAIAKGAMNLMAWAKLKLAAALVGAALIGGMVGAGATTLARHPSASTPTASPAPTPVAAAPTPPPTPSLAAQSVDDSFPLDADAAGVLKIDRRLLRFTDTGGAHRRFHLIAGVMATAERSEINTEIIVERDGDHAALLVRTMRERLPFALVSGDMLVKLDAARSGGVVVARGVSPELVVRAGKGDAASAAAGMPTAMTEFQVAAAARKHIDVDMASLVEGLQFGSTARTYDARFRALRMNGRDMGGRVVVAERAGPGDPPLVEFSVTEKVRQAVALRDVRVDAGACGLPTVTREAVERLGLPVREISAEEAAGDLLPPTGFFGDAANRAAGAALNSLISTGTNHPRGDAAN